jgi:D-threo-aldose 1-dehydrogenase
VLNEVDTDERDTEMFKFGRANRVVYDYTKKGALKSIEGSLNRLGVDRPRGRSTGLRLRP